MILGQDGIRRPRRPGKSFSRKVLHLLYHSSRSSTQEAARESVKHDGTFKLFLHACSGRAGRFWVCMNGVIHLEKAAQVLHRLGRQVHVVAAEPYLDAAPLSSLCVVVIVPLARRHGSICGHRTDSKNSGVKGCKEATHGLHICIHRRKIQKHVRRQVYQGINEKHERN